jgi:hypothetical protein
MLDIKKVRQNVNLTFANYLMIIFEKLLTMRFF